MSIIPESALNQHIVALGKTGSGKSSALRYIVEGLLARRKRVCIIDPKGDWWGIKVAADGKGPGLPLILFGDFKKETARDVPINDRSGKHIAELVSDGNRPCVIGLRGWTQGSMTRFWIDFASALFTRNSGELYLIGDEFHNFAPKQWKGQSDKDTPVGIGLHWANRLLSEGRGLGLVCLIASQRPQKVHNDTLTSCETLVAMRVIHKADRLAVKAWIDGNGAPEVGNEVLKSLAGMPRGEGWVWSPEIGFGPKRLAFPMFSTFDSFAPPQLQKRVSEKGWADVDLSEVKAALADAVKEAEANDPRLLRKRITDLETENSKLKKQGQHVADVKVIERAVDAAVDARDKEWFEIVDGRDKIIGGLKGRMGKAAELLHVNGESIPRAPSMPSAAVPQGREHSRIRRGAEMERGGMVQTLQTSPAAHSTKANQTHQRAAGPSPALAGSITGSQERILNTLAVLVARGLTPNREMLARWLGIHPNGGRYGSDLAALRARGELDGFTLTEAGEHEAFSGDTGLQAALTALPDDSMRRTLQTIVDMGKPVTREELAEALGIHPNGGRYGSTLGWLRTMGVITERGPIAATAALWA